MDNINSQGELKSDSDDVNSSFDLESMDPEQRQKVEEELKTELAKVGCLQNLHSNTIHLNYPTPTNLSPANQSLLTP